VELYIRQLGEPGLMASTTRRTNLPMRARPATDWSVD